MSLTKRIFEHLITKPKYNKKCIECDALKMDITKRDILMNEQKEIFNSRRQEWDKTLKEQESEIIKLKKKIVKMKGELDEKKKEN